jgi:predicted TIM-barrel fold metal-dependent hydrolase
LQVNDDARRIVDPHFHLWNLDENYYPWLSDGDRPTLVKNFSGLRNNYLVSDFLRDIGELNVVAAVHIQAEHDHTDVVRETRWLQKVADDPASRGIPNAIVADADFARPDVERLLEGHCAFANVRGIRHVLHRRIDAPTPYDPLEDPAWHRNFRLLEKYGLSFDMQIFPRQADAAATLIRNNPDIRIALDHAAMPLWNDPENMALWRRAVRMLAAFPNVAIKLSDFGTAKPDWDEKSIDPVVSEVISAFGPERCMLASNFPVEGLAKTYQEIWEIYFRYFSAYSDAEKDMLFHLNAAAFYRIDLQDAGGVVAAAPTA